MLTPDASRPSLGVVAWVLLRVGALAFGGLGAALSLLRRELVERRAWVSERDIADALAFTKPLPGSTVVQVVAFLAWRVGRLRAAIVAAAAFVLPAAALMTAAAAGLAALPESVAVSGALMGIHVAVVGLLAHAAWTLARSEAGAPALVAVLVVAFACGFVVNAALVVALAGLLGALLGADDDA